MYSKGLFFVINFWVCVDKKFLFVGFFFKQYIHIEVLRSAAFWRMVLWQCSNFGATRPKMLLSSGALFCCVCLWAPVGPCPGCELVHVSGIRMYRVLWKRVEGGCVVVVGFFLFIFFSFFLSPLPLPPSHTRMTVTVDWLAAAHLWKKQQKQDNPPPRPVFSFFIYFFFQKAYSFIIFGGCFLSLYLYLHISTIWSYFYSIHNI